MAGAGFDAEMIRDADDLKERARPRRLPLERRAQPAHGRLRRARSRWTAPTGTTGRATCILLGNLGRHLRRRRGVPRRAARRRACSSSASCTAEGLAQWTRTLARTAVGDPGKSPFVRVTKARKVKVELDRKVRYELDGGDRSKVKSFKVKVEPGALRVRVPRRDPEER